MKKHTSYRAIRQFCLQCKNRSYISVKSCPEYQCPLYMYRLGKRPIVSELNIWQRIYGTKIVENKIDKSTQIKGLTKVRKQ